VAGLLEAGLLSREDLWITQAGDNPGPDAVAALDPGLRQMLWEQEYRNVTRVSERVGPSVIHSQDALGLVGGPLGNGSWGPSHQSPVPPTLTLQLTLPTMQPHQLGFSHL
jgi:hypothetical protein